MNRVLLACALLVPAAVSSLAVGSSSQRHRAVIDAETLPQTCGKWVSEAYPLTKEEEAALENPASCQRIYLSPRGDMVQILLLQMSKSQNVHDPKLCMFGAGYRLDSDRVAPSPWSPGTGRQVRMAEFSRSGATAEMTYWIQTPEGESPEIGASLRAASFWRMLTGKGSNGIAVRVTSLASSGSPDKAAADDLWRSLATQMHLKELAESLR